MRKIIVITPVKNEDWILEIFLRVTSVFADAIILADQKSSDASVEIIQKYPKAILIENNRPGFGEAYRQMLLIENARKLFPGEKIVLALDADEIAAASSLPSSDWELMKQSPVGSVFYFEKPDMYGSSKECVRYRSNDYPMGFVDNDSIEHVTKKIHSIRIPMPEDHLKIKVEGIKFLHLCYLRPKVQRSKFRFYMVKENILATSPWYRRRRRYRAPNHLLPWAKVESVPMEWTKYPAELNVDLTTINDTQETWHNDDILEAFENYGSYRFWLDDIWDMDWNALLLNSGLKRNKIIRYPPGFLIWLLKLSDKFNK
jgi:hypothetical protein